MRKLILLLSLVLSSSSFASEFGISSLFCTSGLQRSGTTTLTYTGPYQRWEIFNLTNVPVVGFPFSQQAHLVKHTVQGTKLTLELRTAVTERIVKLEMDSSNNRARLLGADGSSLQVTCSVNIQL